MSAYRAQVRTDAAGLGRASKPLPGLAASNMKGLGMAEPWITVRVGLAKHPKVAELPNDTARFGWIVTLCEAKIQRKPGTFTSDRHYRQVIGRYAKHLPDYIAAGLLERDQDDTLRVHNWRQHQWAVAQARRRDTSMTGTRHDDDNSVTERGHQEDASRAVTIPVSVDVSSLGVGGPGGEVGLNNRSE